MKPTTRAKKLNEKIQAIKRDRSTVIASYEIDTSRSTQAELRMRCKWEIGFPVDFIHEPKRLDRDGARTGSPWQAFSAARSEIHAISNLASGRQLKDLEISARTKNGAAQREEAQATFEIECAMAFIDAYKRAIKPKRLAAVRTAISGLQTKQKEILKEMRAENSRYLADRKAAKAAEREADALALKEGRFWDATPEAIKGYFHPPFGKNRLADVSVKWRAALYLECESTAWKDYNKNWRHKLVGTGRAYLCGIDDNGDEWGHECRIELGCDEHGNVGLDADVEDAMAVLFEIPANRLRDCERQGDLLFCRETIPVTVRAMCPYCGNRNLRPERDTHDIIDDASEIASGETVWCGFCGVVYAKKNAPPSLVPQDGPWEVRESHRIESAGLERNGRWFRSPSPIHITHTSHQPVTLEPGEYRLYTLQIEDAD